MAVAPAVRERVRRVTWVRVAMAGLRVGPGGHSTSLYWDTVCQPY